MPGSWLPSAKIKLIIRLEEYGDDIAEAAKIPTTSAQSLKGISPTRGDTASNTSGKLRAIPDPDAPEGVKRFVIVAGSGTPTTPFTTMGSGGPIAPAATPKSSDDRSFEITGVIPSAATWKQNNFHSADEAEITIRYLDMPFDPRVIRSAAIELFMGTVSASDFAAGVNGATRAASGGGSEPLNVVPDTWEDANGLQRTNSRFIGFVDSFEEEWPEDGEPTIKLKCRDGTQLLTLIQAPPKISVDKDLPLPEAIAKYMANFNALQELVVEYRSTGDPPTLKGALAGTSYQPKLGPQPSKGGGAASDKLNVWDYIYDLCASLGHTVYVEGRTVVIRRIRELMDQKTPARADDPYRTREINGVSFERRTFLYGVNVQSAKVSREFTQKAPMAVELRCYWPERKKVLVARYPNIKSKKQKPSLVLPGDGIGEAKVQVYTVSGIQSEDTLADIAKDIFESSSRGELVLTIRTLDLASLGGDNDDPDLFDMKIGDSIEYRVGRFEMPDASGNTQVAHDLALSILEQNIELLTKMGYPSDVAQRYARAFTDPGLQRIFRLKEATCTWSSDEGISWELTAVNYTEAQIDGPGGEELDAPLQPALGPLRAGLLVGD